MGHTCGFVLQTHGQSFDWVWVVGSTGFAVELAYVLAPGLAGSTVQALHPSSLQRKHHFSSVDSLSHIAVDTFDEDG